MTKLVTLNVFVEDSATEGSIASYADPIQDEIIAIPGVLGVTRTNFEGEAVDELLALAYAADLEVLGVATIPAIEAAETRFLIDVGDLKDEIEYQEAIDEEGKNLDLLDMLGEALDNPDTDYDPEDVFRPPFDMNELFDAVIAAPEPPQRIAAPKSVEIESDGDTKRKLVVEAGSNSRVYICIEEDPNINDYSIIGLTLNEASRLALIKALGGHASPTEVEVTV